MFDQRTHGSYYIYVITNAVTQKHYVGCTADIESRITIHKWALKKHKHPMELMQADYDKYGAESFRVRIFSERIGLESASQLEAFMMKVLKSQNPKHGYNYKDRKGNSPLAIADRWRTYPRNWSDEKRAYYYRKYGVLLPPEHPTMEAHAL